MGLSGFAGGFSHGQAGCCEKTQAASVLVARTSGPSSEGGEKLQMRVYEKRGGPLK